MGWGEEHRDGVGSTRQVEMAHAALDAIKIEPGPLARRVLDVVGRLDRLEREGEADRRLAAQYRRHTYG